MTEPKYCGQNIYLQGYSASPYTIEVEKGYNLICNLNLYSISPRPVLCQFKVDMSTFFNVMLQPGETFEFRQPIKLTPGNKLVIDFQNAGCW